MHTPFVSRLKGISRMMFLAGFVIAALIVAWMFITPPSSANDKKDDPTPKKIGKNYDIRDDTSEAAVALKEKKRSALGQRQRDKLANIGQRMSKAHASLKARIPDLEIVPDEQTGSPEVVGVLSARQKLTGKSKAGRDDVVRGFLSNNADVYGLSAADVSQLKKTADYVNPSGNMAWVEFEQQIEGIPVFQGNLRAGLSNSGELIRTTGKLVSGIDYESARESKNRYLAVRRSADAVGPDGNVSAAGAVAAGAESVGVSIDPADLVVKEVSDDGTSVFFEGGPFIEDIKAELVYFPIETGNITLSWSMVLWEGYPAYYTIVDAETGTVLWRKNITADQTQPATYSYYNDDNPAPSSPFLGTPVQPAVALGGFQALSIPRTTVSLISELPAFDNLGWINDGGTTTTGNNVDAGLDIDSIVQANGTVLNNGIDANGRPISPTRNFVYDYNPAPGLAGAQGSSNPSDTNYRWGAVANLFFWTNRYHDVLYQYGFNEAARNFQQDNFGRNPGGASANARTGVDRVRAEAQDSSGVNNANFSTPPDGSLPRMQMYLWPNPNPDYDGDLDQSVSLHEMTHGTSNRLHNNAAGLNAIISQGMGEGWSDFYARMILATADEDVDGIFNTGGYATFLATANYTNNYYYGIRRFPHAVKPNVGANGKPHNPLTLADIDPNTIDLTDGAFARGPFGTGGRLGAIAVHNIGEVWSIALFEVRARLIKRLGFATGNQRMLQLTTDAMKLDPTNPTLLDGRNAFIAADIAGFGGQDVLDIWAGFATRGMGFGATITPEAKLTSGTRKQNVKESFDNPIPGMGNVTVTENSCHSNGRPDVGEMLTLSIPLTNPLANTITDVSAQVVGGGSANYGSIAAGATVTQDIAFQVPSNASCGSKLTVSVVVTSNLGTETKTFPIQLGTPATFFTQNFDGVAAPALPAGWVSANVSGGGVAWTTTTTNVDSPPNAAVTTFAATTSRSDLVTPPIAIPATGTTQLTFRHSYNSEFDWDGGALFIVIPGVTPAGQVTEILGAGGSFETGSYNWAVEPASQGNTSPLASFALWTGNSGGYITTTVNLPTSAAGKSVQFFFIAASDSSTTVTNSHWRIDSLSLNTFDCDKVSTTTTVAPSSGQYSDQTTLSATLNADCLPTGAMEFRVDSVLVGSVPVSGTGTYSTNYTISNAPGPHTIKADFVSDNPFYQNSNGSNTLTVTQENAAVDFPATNPFAVKVNSPGGTAGPITFCADISEIPDGSNGDTTNATASFAFNPVAGGSSFNVSGASVSYSGGGVGTARRACATITNVPVDVYDVVVMMGNYYTGTGGSVLVVYDPSLGFVTGGGRVTNPGTGCSANFGLNIKYLKNGKPQGSILYKEHCPAGETTLKGNALQSLSIVNGTAVVLGKGPLNGVGNHGFRINVTDNGEPGSADLFGIQITAPNGSILPDYNFAPRTIDGGNIQVPQNPK
jgi:hypothetical protein